MASLWSNISPRLSLMEPLSYSTCNYGESENGGLRWYRKIYSEVWENISFVRFFNDPLPPPTVNILAKKSYFCPNPENLESLFLPYFSRRFFRFFGAGGTNFAVQPNYNLKMARSAKNLGKFDLKCAKIGKNGQKIMNFPIFCGIFSDFSVRAAQILQSSQVITWKWHVAPKICENLTWNVPTQLHMVII